MPPDRSSFTALNIPNDTVPEWMGSFTLAAPPNTDLWRKPPSRDTSTAPILYTALRNPFIAAEVTVSADWELEWDQGGLVIFAGAPPAPIATRTTATTTTATVNATPGAAAAAAASAVQAVSVPGAPTSTTATQTAHSTTTTTTTTTTASSTSTSTSTATGAGQQQHQSGVGTPNQEQSRDIHHRGAPLPPPAYTPPAPASKWVKVGLEFCNNACHATSVCATADGADWALTALPPHHARRLDLRVKIERIGYALWIWYEDDMSGWKKLREVTWFFWGVEDKAVRVGVYASRPANFGTTMYERRHGGPSVTQRNLCVDFEGLEIY